MESRGKKESGLRGLINCLIMDDQEIPKCLVIWLSPGENKNFLFDELVLIEIHLHRWQSYFLPRHLWFLVSPCEGRTRQERKTSEEIGNRSQVAKAWVCKTSIRRFESDRFLPIDSINLFLTCFLDRTGTPGSKVQSRLSMTFSSKDILTFISKLIHVSTFHLSPPQFFRFHSRDYTTQLLPARGDLLGVVWQWNEKQRWSWIRLKKRKEDSSMLQLSLSCPEERR